jgi:hypothetical protein
VSPFPQSPPPKQEFIVQCTRCLSRNDYNESTFCIRCGTNLPAVAAELKCYACNSVNSSNPVTCEECGANLAKAELVMDELNKLGNLFNDTTNYVNSLEAQGIEFSEEFTNGLLGVHEGIVNLNEMLTTNRYGDEIDRFLKLIRDWRGLINNYREELGGIS